MSQTTDAQIPFGELPLIAEGKTKIVRASADNPSTVFLCFKDDITAGDGAKHDVFPGKAQLDWSISRDCFEYLSRFGVRTHYLHSPQDRVMAVRRLDRKIEMEVVSRRVATGSAIACGHAEGTRFDPLLTQFHYKDDSLHDPLLDARFLDYLSDDKGAWEWSAMRKMNQEVFEILEAAFARFSLQLVDIKLEYGIIDGALCVIDEISGGSLRLWPYRTRTPDLTLPNLLSQLSPQQRLDKDTYRSGEAADEVLSKFQTIADVTSRFSDLDTVPRMALPAE